MGVSRCKWGGVSPDLIIFLPGFKGISNFFKPLTCSQLPALRKTCGGKAESFYPKQCLQQKCCHYNGTCYHHVIDGVQQRRNAGILGGSCAGAALLFLSIFIGWFRLGRGLAKNPGTEGEIPQGTEEAFPLPYPSSGPGGWGELLAQGPMVGQGPFL
ncbi:transmembrane protein 190 isoform X1 [Alligator sinensis]|uniref:Transmembrane protein 190 isoform X1 n=1 Tax=Alligator sinensis TaxID=38654 RepID=A0A3Q0GUT8_ALLSI|nr:transmembrane protein 190 isoform X1 [Alligator sinensis]